VNTGPFPVKSPPEKPPVVPIGLFCYTIRKLPLTMCE
jgi:hypothetical protein